MFEELKIKIFGNQPVAKVTDKALARIIRRDFGNKTDEVEQKLRQVTSDTPGGKNRISAAILKLSNKDINAIDHYIEMSNNDFRDVISKAEYPKCSELGFSDFGKQKMRQIYHHDWTQYSKWLHE